MMLRLLVLLLLTGCASGQTVRLDDAGISTCSTWHVTSSANIYQDTHPAVLELAPSHSEELREMATALRTMSEQVAQRQVEAGQAQIRLLISEDTSRSLRTKLRLAAAGCFLLAFFSMVGWLLLWDKHKDLQTMTKVLAKHEARLRELLEAR